MATPITTKAFSADISVDEGERAVTARINTAAVDSDGEVLLPRGCDTKDFEKNPVVFMGHNYFTLPVGKCVAIKRNADEIIAKTVFATRPANHPEGEEWLPDTLLHLFQEKVLRGFSVGMIPIESRPATDRDVKEYGPSVRRIYSKWRMYEYSVAPLPANQEAITLAVAKGQLSPATAKGLFNVEAKPGPVRVKFQIQPEINLAPTVDAIIRKSRGAVYLI